MGTIVTITVPSHAQSEALGDADALIDEALGWFREVERVCSRFDPSSEVQQLSRRIGEPVAVGPLLFEAVRFALKVAAETGGAFDPTVGLQLERLGFNRHYATQETTATSLPVVLDASWRHVHVNETDRTITLERPLLLDLGGVAKGLALDLASRELMPLTHFGIDAGGDLYLGGHAPSGAPWTVGIRHPDRDDVLLDQIDVRDRAVCTSGTYERRSTTTADARHIVNPRDGSFPVELVSATVTAPSAMLADALATAVLVLGPDRGRALLDAHDVCGLLFTSAGARIATRGCGDQDRTP